MRTLRVSSLQASLTQLFLPFNHEVTIGLATGHPWGRKGNKCEGGWGKRRNGVDSEWGWGFPLEYDQCPGPTRTAERVPEDPISRVVMVVVTRMHVWPRFR